MTNGNGAIIATDIICENQHQQPHGRRHHQSLRLSHSDSQQPQAVATFIRNTDKQLRTS